MKLTNTQLRQIIKEELEVVINEAERTKDNPMGFGFPSFQNTPKPEITRVAQAPRVTMDALKVTIENVPSFQDKIEIDTTKFNTNVKRALSAKNNKPLGEELAKVFAFGNGNLKPHVEFLAKAQVYVDKEMVIQDDEAMDDRYKDTKKINRRFPSLA